MNYIELPEAGFTKKLRLSPTPVSINFELTARCNNNCRHCYNNLSPTNEEAAIAELSIAQIESLADQAVKQNVLWCLLTGGEPLLREDFSEIYVMLKKKGLLVSVYSNGCLIKGQHVELFKKYKPRELEITVYGVTEETYEKVTGVKGSFFHFWDGLNLLFDNDIDVTLKAMVLRSNFHELNSIEKFCSKFSKRKFRFDPFLMKRHDNNHTRNKLIVSERLTKDEIVLIEQSNTTRKKSLISNCKNLIQNHLTQRSSHIFSCGILKNGFTISHDGRLRLCSSLVHPDYTCELRNTPLLEAWKLIADKITKATSDKVDFVEKCCECNIVDLCFFCPANAFLETGELDNRVEYFCELAHSRADAIYQSIAHSTD